MHTVRKRAEECLRFGRDFQMVSTVYALLHTDLTGDPQQLQE